MTKRPLSFTLLALGLAWLSLGGFALAYWASVIDSRLGFRVAVGAVGAIYGVAALSAAIGLWKMRTWTVHPLQLWAVATLLGAWLPKLALKQDTPVWEFAFGTVVLGGLVWGVNVYVSGWLRLHEKAAA